MAPQENLSSLRRSHEQGIEISRIYGPLLTLFQAVLRWREGASAAAAAIFQNGHDIQRASANSLNSLGAQNTLRKLLRVRLQTSIYEAIQLNEFLCWHKAHYIRHNLTTEASTFFLLQTTIISLRNS